MGAERRRPRPVAAWAAALHVALWLSGLLACKPPAERSEAGVAATASAWDDAVEPGEAPRQAAASSGPRWMAESPYPPGAWRQSSRAELARTMIWPAHILIRYAGCLEPGSVSFSVADFHSVPEPPTRSRDEARALAREIADDARAEPNRFAELARAHSEDIVLQEAGGSLGGIPASRLSPWPEVLDALSQLQPGQVSDPVETRYGFHVLQRRPPPEPQMVTGRRLVIGHDRAGWLRTLNGGRAPTRSRAEAFELARALYDRGRASPDGFGELIEQHSELRDRIVGGDFGTWSNREPSSFPREVEVLAGLATGELAPPFDSLFGVQVVQRVANRPRAEYAVDGLRLDFNPDVPSNDPRSGERVLELARELNRRLFESPASLEELQKQHPPYRVQWLEGRKFPEVTVALRAVEIGELLPEPTRSSYRYIIGRRVLPRASTPPEPIFELPSGVALAREREPGAGAVAR